MLHALSSKFDPFLMGTHVAPGTPAIYVEYGPFVHEGVGTVVAASEFISVVSVLSITPRGELPLHAIRGCCGARPLEIILADEVKWDSRAAEVLRVGKHSFTADAFQGLVEWMASVPFLDPRHVPHLEFDEGTRVRFHRLCERFGTPIPRYVI